MTSSFLIRLAVFGTAGVGIFTTALGVLQAQTPLVPKTRQAPGVPTMNMPPSPRLEIFHKFQTQMPVGVTVTSKGRVFCSYPRWEDTIGYTLAEIRGGREIPFPRGGAYQQGHKTSKVNNLVSLQGLITDAQDRLWVLDTGTINQKPLTPFVPKLICYNTTTGKEDLKYRFPANIVPAGSYINDLRIDLGRGAAGTVYITDSGKTPGLIVFDIATKTARRRLTNHPSVKTTPKFVPFVEHQPLYMRPKPGVVKPLGFAADSIAISPDGSRLYYAPTASRKLYSVSCAALVDGNQTDAQVAQTVVDLGEKGVADGMLEDRQGRIYTTNYEHNAIYRRSRSGIMELVVHSPDLLWPDTISFAPDGYLYIISNQLHRQGGYNNGKDRRVRPFILYRTKVNQQPVLLKKR